jgi:mannose-1-phosphate guanylyltransferase/mannose-6-phosphate isomerase
VNSSVDRIEVQPVVMAGGSGTRLWPLSRAGHPKQFLVLSGSTSLFQQATGRLLALADADITVNRALVVCNEDHRFLVLDQLREMNAEPAAVMLEPVGRNTAPAVTLAAMQALQADRDPVMVVTAADQTVADPAAFTAAMRRAVRAAAGGAIAILGVTPIFPKPDTGTFERRPAA